MPPKGEEELASRSCKPCTEGTPALRGQPLQENLSRVEGWELKGDRKIVKAFEFDDFVGALDFTNRVGDLAESEGHHPEIHLGYGKVVVELWTHKIDGLSDNDFILAAKIDQL
jgi:4a-hydroxytetrahydrobiopterin dehydratase